MKILLTGGAGFIGFNLLSYLSEQHPKFQLVALDNLKRLGSEGNVEAIIKRGITFIHGDIRNPQELKEVGAVDIIIHCASDASVLSGITSSSELVIQNNLLGSINIFEYAVKHKAQVIFFSTSRVYNCQLLNELSYIEQDTRFALSEFNKDAGLSVHGISEEFPINLSKTFYGATKYCSEILLQEYAAYHGLLFVINRFGLISGKGQFGIQDQGIISYWLKQHYSPGQLSYFGYGGKGKQVRDALHIMDLCEVIDLQIQNLSSINGEIFNIGGGKLNSFSLQELTHYCQNLTGNTLVIENNAKNRIGDIPIYYTDNSKVSARLNWTPRLTIHDILIDLFNWYQSEEKAAPLQC